MSTRLPMEGTAPLTPTSPSGNTLARDRSSARPEAEIIAPSSTERFEGYSERDHVHTENKMGGFCSYSYSLFQ